MRQTGFRFDARKKLLRDKEVFDYLAVGWQLLPRTGEVQKARVSVNFPPDLERVQKRLAAGHVVHERLEQRHPESNALLAIVFEFEMAARANVMVTADHDAGQLQFRLACVGSMDVVQHTLPAHQVNTTVLDELARLVVGEPSRFL
jgi:alpha-D-ribose 1-methylphosphonate 5-triphosphate diphosphatase PhnM